jgi:uridine kinase
MIRRLSRKLKKQLKKKGVNPAEYLKELQVIERRDKHLDKIFPKGGITISEVIQKELISV